jgi:hypothetical protein
VSPAAIAAELLAKLSPAERRAVMAFLASTANDADGTGCSDGKLDLPGLVLMLLRDVALVVNRPGSWEGAGMAQLLSGHGYNEHAAHQLCLEARHEYWGGKAKDPYSREKP